MLRRLTAGMPRAVRLREGDLLTATKCMNGKMIELEGFAIELASELHCERGGDHQQLADHVRSDRVRLGRNLEGTAVLCVRCMKAIPLKA
ncbi:MAG: hypothetical protein JO356_18995 [Acidobacteria bacterium]|nr:hypothetical protein [Acidobacteriota bacterium]